MRLLIALASVALGAAVETLTALTPESLRANWPNGAVEETRPALFGQPQYGRRYEGRVTYATVGDRDGCLPLTRDSNWPAEGTPLILMVDRGNCTFVTKVRHAENAGAIAVIVVDNVELSSEPFMADDGTGWELTIPSVLVHRHDGLKFEALATQGLPMTAALQWNSPKREIVEYTLWTSSADWSAIRFKRRWLPAFRSLVNSRFTPRYGFYNGTADGCFNTNNCEDFCTNNGRYCDWDEWQIGKLVIQENVRQLCIWQIYGASRPELWWNYVAYFDQECQDTFNDACSRAGQTSVGIDVNEVAQCVTASGGTDDNGGVNTLLEAELEALNVAEDVWWLPTISVNGEPYRGTLNCADVTDHGSCGVLTAICDGYPAGRSPSICRTSAGCPIGEIRDECGVCGGQGVNDACGQCMPRSNPLFNKTCAGCDGVPNSGKVRDGCGVCGGNGVFEQCVNVLLQPLRNEIQQLRAQINPACLTQGSDRRAASADCVREPTRGGGGSAVGVGVAVTLSLAVLVIIGVVAIRRRNSNLYRMSDYTQQEDNHRAALLDS